MSCYCDRVLSNRKVLIRDSLAAKKLSVVIEEPFISAGESVGSRQRRIQDATEMDRDGFLVRGNGSNQRLIS